MTSLSKDKFPQLLKKLRQKLDENGKAAENLISGFRKTGLCPLDPSEPKRRLPPEENNNQDSASLVSSAVVEFLKEMRYDPALTPQTRQRKKITVEPGKSVSANDIAQPSTSKGPKPPKTQKKKSFIKQSKKKTNKNATPSSSSDEESSASFEPDEGGQSPESFNSDDLPLLSRQRVQSHFSESNNDCEAEDTPQMKECKELPKNPKLDDWVLVEYPRKNVQCHFVGKIIKISDSSDTPYTVDFLKKSTKTERYLRPPEEDKDEVSTEMILKILQNPKLDGSGKRVFFTFSDDFSSFNCQ